MTAPRTTGAWAVLEAKSQMPDIPARVVLIMIFQTAHRRFMSQFRAINKEVKQKWVILQ
jgi:hypothetical protein